MATIPSETTAAVGNKITAASWNSNVRDAVNFLLGGAATRKPTFRSHLAVAQSVPNNTATTIKFDTSDEDTDSAYSTTTGIYTCVTAGLYLFDTNLTWSANGTGARSLLLLSTGAPTNGDPPVVTASADNAGRIHVSLITRLTAGQTVKVQATQTSGGSLNTSTGASISFAGCYLAA